MGKKKGLKISKVKRSNQRRNKLGKQGKLKTNKSKHPGVYYGRKPEPSKQPQQKPPGGEEEEEEDENLGEEMLEMMEQDDIKFLESAVTKRSYKILQQIRLPTVYKKSKRTREIDDDDKLERMYEEELDQPEPKRTKLLLPIKTKEGLVMRTTEVDEAEEERKQLQRQIEEKKKEEERKKKKKKKKGGEEEEEEKVEEEEDEDLKMLEEEEEEDSEEEEDEDPEGAVTAVDLLACREELLRKRKFQIGLLAAGLLETPEMKVRNFKFLLEMLDTDESEVKLSVRKLVAISLLEVFKDLLPSYQIKHQEPPPGFKLKKKTVGLQNYEKSLLKAYKMYLQSLERMSGALRRKRGDARPCDPEDERLGLVAIRCLMELLIRHPYFNFSPNIGQALVHFLDNKDPAVRELVAKGLRTVLREDKRGELSLHIVRRINHLVRSKNHSVRPEVLTVLLALRLRDVNLDAEKEAEMKEKKFMTRKQKLLNWSKRECKRNKRLEEVEREMLETKAEENKQSKQKHLTEVTKAVFTIFFRVLKRAPSSKLLSVTLEGLAKFAHCINLEFFQDLVNVLDHLLVDENLGHVEQLHCVETVFTILSGQGEVLNIDPLRFYSHLYRCLLEVHAGRTSADAVVALRALEKAVIVRRRKTSMQRLLAFTKRVSTLSLWQLHGGALGFLAVARNMLTQTRSCDVLLDTDPSHGDGVYQPELPEPEYCGAGATALWELPLLARHYHPEVQQMAKCIMKGDGGVISPDIVKLSPSQLAEAFACREMAFRPAVPPPKKAAARAHHGRVALCDDELALHLQKVEESVSFAAPQNRGREK